MEKSHIFSILLFVCVGYVQGDTPANCTYEDIRGTWIFSITKNDGNNTIDCDKEKEYTTKYKVTLDFPNLAVDSFGNTGFWTLIYNQGFEVVIGGKKYFAFSYYKNAHNGIESMCYRTFPGWFHDLDNRNWGCYYGEKATAQSDVKKVTTKEDFYDTPFMNSKQFISDINKAQTSWKAVHHPMFENKKTSDVIRMSGGRRSARAFPTSAPIIKKHLYAAKNLPKEFDWRNHEGKNFVSPIRNQGNCGSCYAFGSMAMHEARLRVLTNNTMKKVFSTQDVVSCSEYSQGCDGGFPYLIAGKYGQDFGLVEEECFLYEGRDMPCKQTTCQRHYTRDYYYIGGYYGACNEPLMREELVKNGPIAISFEVYKDFTSYKGGIYHHTEVEDKFNPWEITNHVVLVVGYGEERGQPYWIVKNSWGPKWGEDGFFRIRRGVDECSMESMAVGTIPVV